jgi:hypothetical protein
MRLAQMRFCVVLAGVAMAVVPAWSATIPLGANSGWSASLAGAATGINVVSSDGQTLVVSITKNFGAPDITGQIPIAQVTFIQTGTTAVSRITIQSEDIANNSGVNWTAFRWSIFETGVAMFNTDSSWNISPFTTPTWQGINGGNASTLEATDGTVSAGTAYEPSGSLLIDAVAPENGHVRFTLKETAIPEPTTLALLAVGGLLLRRRGRQ